MNIGFHYHIPFYKKHNKLYVPSYLGVFIDELAKHAETLFLFMEHVISNSEADYELQSSNIRIIDLGSKSSFYRRLLLPSKKLKLIIPHLLDVDHLILRSPSPLSPHISRVARNKTHAVHFLVGDYVKGLKELQQPFWRKWAIVLLTHYYQHLQRRMIRNAHVLVNSLELYDANKSLTQDLYTIKTTTLNKNSFYERNDTCQHNTIRILYTGRINFQKGLRELLQAVSMLIKAYTIEIDIVGWEDAGKFSYTEALKKEARVLGVIDSLHFHGKKKVGDELNSFYRKADIYCIPSYHEGFPRTIWEAMANSLPVIATRVGSIPGYLSEKTTLLIDTKNVNQLKAAIEEVITNEHRRKSIIKASFEYAQDCTLENQTKKMVDLITSFAH
jgi:glycosyltransferase involved in cell wall biosynthesis